MKWQPMMLITDERIECECGSLAIFIFLTKLKEVPEDKDYTCYCQACYEKIEWE